MDLYYNLTDINHLPDVILSNIIAAVSDVRSRNCAALVCRKWLHLERCSRRRLTVRGNARDLHMAPSPCFQSVVQLDLSLVSPWGHPLLLLNLADPPLLSHLLASAFPNTTSLTLYSRSPDALHLLLPYWPNLSYLKLVRWHQRPQLPSGADFLPLFHNLSSLFHLDLSCFYCWPEDLYPALNAYPHAATRLTSLNLLNPSFSEGFKAQEVEDVTRVCPNLREFLVACMFDPRYLGFVGDQTMLAVARNCPKLVRLHMVDKGALVNARADPDEGGGTVEAARVTVTTLIEMFSGLPLLEDFALDVCNDVRDSGPAFEAIRTKCPRLRRLKVGQLQGICMPVESKLDGIALCQGLESLSIRNVDDLTDFGLIAIARGCSGLVKFEVEGCKQITMRGMRTLASLLKRSLVEVNISCCKNLGAFSSLKALEPIQGTIQRLHIDCVWDVIEEFDGVEVNFDLNRSEDGPASEDFTNSCESAPSEEMCHKKKRRKYNCDNHGNLVCHLVEGATSCGTGNGNGHINVNGDGSGYGFYGGTWKRLQYLSLWISVGDILNPLVTAGLQNCPTLEEIRIKVEGDCRDWSKPSHHAFGLSSLDRYYKLSKMNLDCGDMIGFTHTAPSGHIDLSLWERFYLLGIQTLRLSELDYWPPQDRDVNQRSLSLPAAGLFQECITLRKLFIHGTANEHFMTFLLNIPNLRDVQLREDYYPAPENDMSTEMRADSCSRFEDALNAHHIID